MRIDDPIEAHKHMAGEALVVMLSVDENRRVRHGGPMFARLIDVTPCEIAERDGVVFADLR